MQASKILPGKVYAIKRYSQMKDSELVCFLVKSVTTTRYRATGSPHDYSSMVSGVIVDDRVDGVSEETIQIDPDRVLGPFDEYVELVERQRREKAEQEAKEKAEYDKVMSLWRLLYEKTGQPIPNDPKHYNNIFRLEHSGGIGVNKDGVQALIDFFNK